MNFGGRNIKKEVTPKKIHCYVVDKSVRDIEHWQKMFGIYRWTDLTDNRNVLLGHGHEHINMTIGFSQEWGHGKYAVNSKIVIE